MSAYHNHEVIQYISKAPKILGWGTILIIPGQQGAGSSKVEVLSNGVLAKLLQELQKVGSIILVDGVAPKALPVGVLPIKVQTIQGMLLGKVNTRLDKSSAVLLVAKVGREVSGASPATDGDKSLDAVLLGGVDEAAQFFRLGLGKVKPTILSGLGKGVLGVGVFIPGHSRDRESSVGMEASEIGGGYKLRRVVRSSSSAGAQAQDANQRG
ncbi:hypothetical protein HG531_008959 [Fusarium graminearum]|nr:hypothetical protein HG531_008959 [Fusarium graminearum]